MIDNATAQARDWFDAKNACVEEVEE